MPVRASHDTLFNFLDESEASPYGKTALKATPLCHKGIDEGMFFLPAYSPDFDPIEGWWAVLKRFVTDGIRAGLGFYEAIEHFFKKEKLIEVTEKGFPGMG